MPCIADFMPPVLMRSRPFINGQSPLRNRESRLHLIQAIRTASLPRRVLLTAAVSLLLLSVLMGWQLTVLMQLSREAEEANLQRTAQAFRANMELAHTAWLINNKRQAVSISADEEHRTMVLNNAGWPVDALPGQGIEVTPEGCARLWQAVFGKGIPRVDTQSLTQESGHEYSAVLSAGTVCFFASRRLSEGRAAGLVRYETQTGKVSVSPN